MDAETEAMRMWTLAQVQAEDPAAEARHDVYAAHGLNAPPVFSRCLFAEEKLDRETALKIASGFGGGMAGMRDVCGAVSGMFMAYGLLCGPADPTDRAAKTNNYPSRNSSRARSAFVMCAPPAVHTAFQD